MDIFKMANQLAKNMSDTDKDAIENMDMEKMISHVTQNVFKMMNNTGGGAMPDFMDILKGGFGSQELDEDPKIKEIIYPKTRDICFDLNIDLEDFYNGKKKKLNIKRKRIVDVDGKQKVIDEKKKIEVIIEKGMKDEQQIRFEGEADQIPGYTPGDIIITLIENEHPCFQRDSDNLVLIKNINLYQLYDISFDVIHLDKSILRIVKNDNDSLHLNDSLRKIPGLGMPIFKSKKSEHGDLFIRFNLNIPKTIPTSKLLVFKELFDTDTEILSETFTKKCILENVSDTDIEDLDSSDSDYSEESDSDLSSISDSSEESPKRKK
jgi:DnaJ-class molecular chaperone